MSDLTAASANAMLDAAFVTATTYYLSLHTADPGTTGASEVSGGSYARQTITFAAASGGSKASSSGQTYTAMPAVTVHYVGVWTASSGGTFKGGGTGTATPVAAGKNFTIASGAIVMGVS